MRLPDPDSTTVSEPSGSIRTVAVGDTRLRPSTCSKKSARCVIGIPLIGAEHATMTAKTKSDNSKRMKNTFHSQRPRFRSGNGSSPVELEHTAAVWTAQAAHPFGPVRGVILVWREMIWRLTLCERIALRVAGAWLPLVGVTHARRKRSGLSGARSVRISARMENSRPERRIFAESARSGVVAGSRVRKYG